MPNEPMPKQSDESVATWSKTMQDLAKLMKSMEQLKQHLMQEPTRNRRMELLGIRKEQYRPPIIKFKKLHPDAVIPKRAHPGDAGLDLCCVSSEWESNTWCIVYHTGLAVEIPFGYVGLLFMRSSICFTNLSLRNAVGVVDAGYRGEILFKYFRYAAPISRDAIYIAGERVGQLVIVPCMLAQAEEAAELTESSRGIQGHGSTGA